MEVDKVTRMEVDNVTCYGGGQGDRHGGQHGGGHGGRHIGAKDEGKKALRAQSRPEVPPARSQGLEGTY